MNRMRVIERCIFALAALLACMRCTIGPTTGTETGNPDISACCTMAIALFDTTDRWLVAPYLVEGESQLDPQKVNRPPSAILLAKQAATASSVDSAGAATTTGSGTVIRLDTIVVRDTLFVKDTIIIDTVVTDTTHPDIGGDAGSSILITQRIRYDSIFLVDTVFTRDTFVLFTVDSSKTASGTVDKSADIRYDQISEAVPVANYSVVRDSISGAVSLKIVTRAGTVTPAENNASYAVRTGSLSIMAIRQMVVGATFISETYRDADGDGLLLSARTGVCARSLGNFIYRGSAVETQLQVDFDAGTDNQFSTTADNRISSLWRTTIRNNSVVDQVRYGALFFGRSEDTILLQRDRTVLSDSTGSVSDRYTCLPGADPLDHRKNSCSGVLHTVRYRSGHLLTTEISVIPSLPVAPGQRPVTGDITAVIDYGKGLTGVLTGVVDYQRKTISGTYAQAGAEYHLLFDGSGNTITLQPFE